MSTIPDDLKQHDNWVLWRYQGRDGKRTKVPYCVYDSTKHADTSDPQTWDTYASAERALRELEGTSRRADGLGRVFSAGDGLCGVDLDNCLGPDGAILPWAQPYVRRLAGSYGEISPSGRGLKFWVRAELPGRGTRKTGFGPDGSGAIEIYDCGRYFTVTGNSFDPGWTTVEDRQEAISALYHEIAPKPSRNGHEAPSGPPLAGDDELIQRAKRAKNGDAFTALFEGRFDGSMTHSEADYKLCCHLAFWLNRDASAIDRVFRRSGLMRDKWDERRGATTYGAITIDKAIGITTKVYTPRPKGQKEPVTDSGSRAGVAIEDTTVRHVVFAEALAVLRKIPDLYYRGRFLVRLARHETDDLKLPGGTTVRHALGMAHVAMLGKAGLSCQLTRVAEFFRWRAGVGDREPQAYPVHPPAWLMEAILEHEDYPGVRPLKGIAGCPFPRPDGSIVTEPGYDPHTGMFLAPSFPLEPLPDQPTQEDARGAARRLFGLVKQFPFAGDSKEEKARNFAAWLAGLLGVIARPAIDGECPGVAFNGNKAGTGKGKLIDLIAIIAMGRRAPTATYPEDKAEFVKFKVSLALQAFQMIHIDNLEEGSSYGGDVLDSALTSSTPGDRVLGSNKTPEGIELLTLWFLSGNNISPWKDAYRRWLVCALKTMLENPEERADLEHENILGHAMVHRAELVRDALIILKAHALAGRPKGPWSGRLGSFEVWDKVVRGAVWFATDVDCYATQRDASKESPDRMKRVALLEGWLTLPRCEGPGASGMTVKDALAEVEKDPATYPALLSALKDLGKDGKLVTSDSLGKIIRAMRDNPISDMVFQKAGEKHRALLWQVTRLKPTGEDDEDDEDPPSHPRASADFSRDMSMCSKAGNRERERLGRSSSSSSSSPPDGVPVGESNESDESFDEEDIRRTPFCPSCGLPVFGDACIHCVNQ